MVGKAQVKSATTELRKAASRFGAARDHHVMVTLLTKLARKAKSPKLQSSLNEALNGILDAYATTSQANAEGALAKGDEVAETWQRDRQRWESLEMGPDTDATGGGYGRKGLRRIFKQARKLHQLAVTERNIERWHDLRKWVKYLSLTVPLCGDDPATAIAAQEWTQLGKTLGKLHDYDELVKRIEQLTPDRIDTKHAARAIRWITGKRDRLCVQCDMHARRLLAQRPKLFAKALIPD
jgi:hypothetical protein